MTGTLAPIRFALVVLIGAILDHATKAWARSALEAYAPGTDFLPFISLRLTFNQGISFGLFAADGQTGKVLLLAVTAIITIGLAIWAWRSQSNAERTALSLIVAGATSNLIDRALHGAVTDMLDLHFGRWHPFVFNLADVWISAGVGLLLLISLCGQHFEAKRAQ